MFRSVLAFILLVGLDISSLAAEPKVLDLNPGETFYSKIGDLFNSTLENINLRNYANKGLVGRCFFQTDPMFPVATYLMVFEDLRDAGPMGGQVPIYSFGSAVRVGVDADFFDNVPLVNLPMKIRGLFLTPNTWRYDRGNGAAGFVRLAQGYVVQMISEPAFNLNLACYYYRVRTE